MNWYLEVLRKYADFDGRASRAEYWTFTLINLLIIWGGFFLTGVFNAPIILLATFIYILAMIIPTLSVLVRRLHDTNKSGALALLLLLPGIGGFILFILSLLEGDFGTNQYGPSPIRGNNRSRVDSRMKVIDPIEDEIVFPNEQVNVNVKEKEFEMPSDDVFL